MYAHGRTYIDVSFSCLYGVPLVYARGRTRIDRALAWLVTIYVSPHSCVVLDVSCLYGVPLVYARGRTYIAVIVWCTVCLYGVIVWCTVCLVGVPFMFCLVLTLIGLIMFVWCTVSVRTRSYLH